MAGLYRITDGQPEFCILTRTPADGIAFIHDRMPVILPSALVGDWIDPRRSAGEILERAVLDVAAERERGEAEQLRMPF